MTDPPGPDAPVTDASLEQICVAIRAGDRPGVLVAAHAAPARRRRELHEALSALWQEFGYPRDFTDHEQAGVRVTYRLACAAVAERPADAVRQVEWLISLNPATAQVCDPQDWVAIAAARGPAWRERFAASLLSGRAREAGLRWRIVHALVGAGLVDPPLHPHYVEWLLFAFPITRLSEAADDDPALAELLPQLFRTPDVGLRLAGWRGGGAEDPADRLTAIYAPRWRGLLDAWGASDPARRPRIIDDCLTALSGSLPDRDAPGFVAVHDRLDVTLAEAASRQERYASLLRVAPSATVVMARAQIRRLLEAGLLEPDSLLEVSAEVLLRKEKVVVREQLRLLTDAVSAGAVDPGGCADVVVGALDPGRTDLTMAMARLLARCARTVDDDAMARLRATVAAAVPEPWPELRRVLGPLAEASTGSAAAAAAHQPEAPDRLPGRPSGRSQPGPPAPIDLPEPGRVEPVPDVDTLCELVSQLLVDPSSAVDVERALDGMARLRDPRPTVAAELGVRQPSGWTSKLSYPNAFFFVVRAWLGLRSAPVQAGFKRWGQVDDPADAPEGATLRRPAEEALRSTPPPKAWLWEVVEPTQTPQFLLYRRLVGVGLGHVTGGALGLLATPTSTNGTISGDAFLSRLSQHRRLASNPRVRDLGTALLRIEPADRDGVLRSITSGSVHERLTLLLAEPQWRREVARLRGGFTTIGDERADAAVWQSVDPPQGAPDDPVCGWLNTRSLVEHWGDHGFQRALGTGATADLNMWALTLPSHPDLVATHLQPELTRWVDEADADISGVLTALARSRRPFGGPASSALVWAAGFRNARTRSAAAEAIGTAARHGTLAGHDLGRELLAVLGPDAGPFPTGHWREVLQPPLSRVMKTLTDASRLSDHAGFAVLAAVTELLGVVPALKGGFAVVELAAQLAERYRVHVDLPEPLAAIASSRSSSRTAQEARRLAAAGRGVSS